MMDWITNAGCPESISDNLLTSVSVPRIYLDFAFIFRKTVPSAKYVLPGVWWILRLPVRIKKHGKLLKYLMLPGKRNTLKNFSCIFSHLWLHEETSCVLLASRSESSCPERNVDCFWLQPAGFGFWIPFKLWVCLLSWRRAADWINSRVAILQHPSCLPNIINGSREWVAFLKYQRLGERLQKLVYI